MHKNVGSDSKQHYEDWVVKQREEEVNKRGLVGG